MRILLVEDDIELGKLIQDSLSKAGFAVDVATDGISALKLVMQTDLGHGVYAAAIVDVMLPGLDGLSLVQELRQKQIEIPVLILSAKRSVDERIEGLQSGGDDYLTKPFAFGELLARLQALLRRSVKTAEADLHAHGVSLDLLKREVSKDGKCVSLQPKEFLLLELLMKNSNRIVSKTEILKVVWNYDFDPQTNVVDVLVCRLRNKINDEFQVRLIETIRGYGYVVKSHP